MAMSDAKPESLQDVQVKIKSMLKLTCSGADALIVSGASESIAAKVASYFLSSPIKIDGKLKKLLKSSKVSEKYSSPLVQIYNLEGGVKVVLRIPDLSDEDTLSKNCLESLATLLHYTIGVASENILIQKDKELGKTLVFETVHNKLIDELTSSAAMRSGYFPGQILELGSYKGNLPCILASLHLLARKQNFLRKRTPQKDEKVVLVTSQELRTAFNTRTGLVDKSNSFPAKILKSCLAVITSSSNKVFPGGWIVSNRELNKVKSDTGLVFKLGYAEKVPDYHKLDMVLSYTTSVNPSNVITIRNQKEPQVETWGFMEFRAGTRLTAPFLDPSKESSFDQQRKTEPLRVKSDVILESFNDIKYHKTINTLNRAHAILLNIQKGGKKTKPIHYEQARNEFLHSCAKIPIKDGTGKEFSKLSELPNPVYKYCAKTFRFPSKQENVDAMAVDLPEPSKIVASSDKGSTESPTVKLGTLKRSRETTYKASPKRTRSRSRGPGVGGSSSLLEAQASSGS
jgi:hypothetical protein